MKYKGKIIHLAAERSGYIGPQFLDLGPNSRSGSLFSAERDHCKHYSILYISNCRNHHAEIYIQVPR
jgi:hypothetical protein